MPPEVEQAIDKRSSMAAVGNLNDFVKYQMGKGFESGGGAGAGGHGSGTGRGLRPRAADDEGRLLGPCGAVDCRPLPSRRRAAGAAALPDLLSPAEAAQALGVSEADVMAVLESGDLKGKKIGTTWRISRAALTSYMNASHAAVRTRILREHHPKASATGRTVAQSWRSPRSRSMRARRAARRPSGTPTKQKLICPFCGTESPYQFDRETGKVVELDLVRALRELPEDERGWQTALRSVQCQSCRAVMVFDPDRVGQNCEFCGSPALVSYEEIKAPIRPQGILPFKIDSASVRDDIRRWWRSKWFAPGPARARRPRRHGQEPLHPVLDLRRAGPLPAGRPRQATTTTSTSQDATARAAR